MGKHEFFTGAQRVAKRRAALRAQGLRPKQIWLPDMRNAAVRSAVRADADVLARQAHRWDALLDEMDALQADLLGSEEGPAAQ